jgi:hydroxymethylpyrimidine pyrophosphatase-like HAD family hydrolase
MAAYFFDIDGTLVYYHTNDWLPGAFEKLKRLYSQGNQIILITMRGPQDDDKEWSIQRTKDTILQKLKEENIQFTILFGIHSPRIIVDDNLCMTIKRDTNQYYD